MTKSETRDAIVAYVREAGGWVPGMQVAIHMRTVLRTGPHAGGIDLRELVREGRLERRPTQGGFYPRYEYRSP